MKMSPLRGLKYQRYALRFLLVSGLAVVDGASVVTSGGEEVTSSFRLSLAGAAYSGAAASGPADSGPGDSGPADSGPAKSATRRSSGGLRSLGSSSYSMISKDEASKAFCKSRMEGALLAFLSVLAALVLFLWLPACLSLDFLLLPLVLLALLTALPKAIFMVSRGIFCLDSGRSL